MKFIKQSPKNALKGFSKKPFRDEMDSFKLHLKNLLDKISTINSRPKEEREEHLKNDVRDFLRDTFYINTNAINTKENKDLVIHLGKKTNSDVGVILEAKRPTNISEMVTSDNVNKKALHELILYYFEERIKCNNNQLKQLVITNINEWYLIDANFFDKYIYRNSTIRKLYDLHVNDKKDTRFFYEELQKLFEKQNFNIPCVFFDLRDYEKPLRNNNKKDDRKLIELFKLLSPEYLLKLESPNDSNSLDEGFYRELLHIIGLEEAKVKGRNIIRRKESKNSGSLLEMTIRKLKTKGLRKIADIQIYGHEEEEQFFNIGLELCITWINRILFLKLLEGQLKNYHDNDGNFLFLNKAFIFDFDELFKLFHDVLAVEISLRDSDIQTKFKYVPYLNSSLFDITEIEDLTISVDSLDNNEFLDFIDSSVLKKVKKHTNKLNTLDYLFQFLDAYDFASETTEDIQEENKNIINASVLGKVFEKINGYREGSIFTPAFITMHMCKHSIRLSIVDKFNEDFKAEETLEFDSFEDVKNYTSRHFKPIDILRFNRIINSIKVCDPAVGSGHFLVSALNEIIAIKSELGILADKDGELMKGCEIEIINDELLITDHQGNRIEYKMVGQKPINREIHKLQKMLFFEKQYIIENCLFGIDINPNSVKICRLRLWIELLKNAFYREEKDFSELETLPNIDINIKCGNSLISRFDVRDDVFDRVPNYKKRLNEYKFWVNAYKNAKSKGQKNELMFNINMFNNEFKKQDPKIVPLVKDLEKKTNEFYNNYLSKKLFAEPESDKLMLKREEDEFSIASLTKKIEEIKNDPGYKNAFEWRFEFPEVLDQNGDYEGFDVIIGNPPYMRVQEIEKTQPRQKAIYENMYRVAKGSYDLANLFFELAIRVAKKQSKNGFIFPHKFLNSDGATEFRDYLVEGKFIDKLAHFGANMIFENADTYTCIAFFSRTKNLGIDFQRFKYKSNYYNDIINDDLYQFLSYERIKRASKYYGSNNWILFDNENGFNTFEKIYRQKSAISKKFNGIYQGIATSKDDLFGLDLIDIKEDTFLVSIPLDKRIIEVEKEFFKPFLMGKEVQRYQVLKPKKVVFFPYHPHDVDSPVTLDLLKEKYPKTFNYVTFYEKEFKKRENGRGGKLSNWFAYIYPKNLGKFEQPKMSSMEICSTHPNVTLNYENLYHTTKVYSWIKNHDVVEDYKYFLAIVNSKLIWWFLKNTGDTLQGDARTFKTNYLNPFPLPSNVSKEVEQQMIELVDEIMLKKSNSEVTTNLENQLNEIVYSLYDLDSKDIEIIEVA